MLAARIMGSFVFVFPFNWRQLSIAILLGDKILFFYLKSRMIIYLISVTVLKASLLHVAVDVYKPMAQLYSEKVSTL